MKKVNIYEAKTKFSLLIADALKGEEVVIARHGKPLVRLTPVQERKPSDAFGMDRGTFEIPSDFDETPDDFKEYL